MHQQAYCVNEYPYFARQLEIQRNPVAKPQCYVPPPASWARTVAISLRWTSIEAQKFLQAFDTMVMLYPGNGDESASAHEPESHNNA
jgi:hypothetical protein